MKPWYALVGSERSKRLLSPRLRVLPGNQGQAPAAPTQRRSCPAWQPGAWVSWLGVIGIGWGMYSKIAVIRLGPRSQEAPPPPASPIPTHSAVGLAGGKAPTSKFLQQAGPLMAFHPQGKGPAP